jgi:hypothetical protein
MKRITAILFLMPTLGSGQWTQVGSPINGQMSNDRCGWSTAISANGNIVAMGSPFNQNGGGSAGQVRVFEWTNDAWTQIGSDLNGETGGDQTGQAVSLSSDGSIVAIGEPFNNDPGYTSGQVRVFQNINSEWSQVGQDLYGESALAGAGTSVDLSDNGTIVAFGAPNTPVDGFNTFVGNVEVFELQNNNWVQRGGDIEGDGLVIKFGQSVSLSADGNIIAIGQTGDPTNSDTGRVKIYEYLNNQWVQLGSTILGTTENDEFGYEVSLSAAGNILAIGSYTIEEVKVFEFINGDWIQIGNTLTGETNGGTFGFSLSLSASGSLLAVGDRFNSIDGNQTGRAYVFENQEGEWTPIANPIVGAAVGDQAGFSVSITQDGYKVAVGSTNGKDDQGNVVGHVRVFENSSILNTDYLDEVDLVKIYPNPATEEVKIQSKQNINSYQIFSIVGEMVEQKNISNLTQFSIDIQNLISGMYILMLQTQNGETGLRLVKD